LAVTIGNRLAGGNTMFSRRLGRFFFSRNRSARVPAHSNQCRRLFVEPLEARDLPAPLTWAAGVSLPTARAGVVAVAQAGDILVLGGPTTDAPGLSVTDPTWRATLSKFAPQRGVRISGGVGIAPDGSVLLFGGQDKSGALAGETSVYDYTGNNSDSIDGLNTPRRLFGFATDEQHHIYAIGGKDSSGTPLASVEYYNQGAAAPWTSAASLPQTLYAESAVADGAGHLFTFGGVGANGKVTDAVYRYTIATNTWDTVAPLPMAVRNGAAVLASNGRMYVLGGITTAGTTASVESYSEATNTWTIEAPLPAPVSSEAAITDYLGRIEVLGGNDASNHATAAVWISQELNQPDAAPAIYSYPVTAAGTGAPYTYQVLTTANPQATYSLTSAPPGMSINATTGLISWTPTVSQLGSFSATVQASNSIGHNSQTFSIFVRQSPPTVPGNLRVTGATTSSVSFAWNPSSDPTGVTGYEVYSVTLVGHSGRGGGYRTVYTPVASATGTSATATGLHSGTSYTFVVAAFDSAGLASGYSNRVITVTDTLPSFTGQPAGTTFNLTAKHPFTLTLSATGNPTDFTYSIVNPPSGMTVGGTSGMVSWTPPDSYVGTTNVTFQVTSSAGTGGTVDYNFAVAPNLPVPTYTSANLTNGTLYAAQGQALRLQLADSSSHSAVTWSIVSGPQGMTVNPSTGLVAWTPSNTFSLGVTNVTFGVSNYAGNASLAVPIQVVFASAPLNLAVSNVVPSGGLQNATITWQAPTTSSQSIVHYELLVSQPGGPTGRFTTTYTLSGTTLSYTVTGLSNYSLIGVELVAVDANGDLGMPSVISFVTT
jgi:hypothetical protein